MIPLRLLLLSTLAFPPLHAQVAPYDNPPPVAPPVYRVRYEASDKPGGLVYAASFTIWIPAGVAPLRGVVVHQHGCGEGSCKSGQTGAYDLHWQALAKKHGCALLSPSYEQPDKANCGLWCDPRNGSDAAFQRALVDLGAQSGHPELATVPWALWGHSGGGHWAGGMLLLHPERVAAVWLRSGVPPLEAAEGKPPPYAIPPAALRVPVMANLGTREGFTVTEGRFAGVWKSSASFVLALRAAGGLAGASVDPFSSHDCGNQRYLAIPWFDTCLSARLPARAGEPLRPMPAGDAHLVPVPVPGAEAVAPVPAALFTADPAQALWLPTAALARAWTQYMRDTAVADTTPPPAPFDLRVEGNRLAWQAGADLESGLAAFLIERDGVQIARIPAEAKNPLGRPLFQNLQYSDTPGFPLVPMRFDDGTAKAGKAHAYRVVAVNTAGLKSE